MKKTLSKFTLLSLITAAALIAVPAISTAQDSTTPPAAGSSKKSHGMPFRGKISAVDATAMTLTIGKSSIEVTSETKIMKDGKPATFSDLAVGDLVSGYGKKDDAGKVTASSIRVGGGKKPKSSMTNTNQ